MALLNPNTPIGKMRLRVGDFSDFSLMPDEVYQSALDDCQGNVPRACVLVATYILASLTGQTHQKLAQIEVYGGDWFAQYLQFVKAVILNPNLMPTTAMPYLASTVGPDGCVIQVPIDKFVHDWNELYARPTRCNPYTTHYGFDSNGYSGDFPC